MRLIPLIESTDSYRGRGRGRKFFYERRVNKAEHSTISSDSVVRALNLHSDSQRLLKDPLALVPRLGTLKVFKEYYCAIITIFIGIKIIKMSVTRYTCGHEIRHWRPPGSATSSRDVGREKQGKI